MRAYFPELLALPLLPFLILQGRKARRRTPRLPEASGPCHGSCPGEGGERPLRLIAVGESTVAGVGVVHYEQAIAARLAHVLAMRARRTVCWQAFGKNGVTADEALHDVVPAVPAEKTDLLLVALGVNDTTAFRPVARWRADMQALLDALQKRCRPELVLLSGVPPVGRFPALPQPLRGVLGLKANALDRVLAELAGQRPATLHVPLQVDVGDPALMASDGYHPSAAGCDAWADVLGTGCEAWVQRTCSG